MVIVSVAVNCVARPIAGVGTLLPTFAPPIPGRPHHELIGGRSVAALAYVVAGTLGALIGADILNVPHIRRLGAPVAAIGALECSTASS